MSKLLDKYKENYDLSTLRDVSLASLSEDQILEYDSSNQQWVNRPRNEFGRDFEFVERVGQQNFTGNQFQTYTTLTFEVTKASSLYRVNFDFLWGHNSASNDIRAAISLDGGANVKELRIEPKDAGTDQRFQNSILKYFNNLSVGTHTVELLIRPSSANRVSRVYEAIGEVWRCR